MAFSPGGKTLATAGSDNTVRVWDLARHRQVGDPVTGSVYAIALSPDGNTLAAISLDHVQIRDLASPTDLLAELCAITGRSLTREEWDRFAPSEKFQQVCP
jgi:WD40 repeat protein